MAEDYSISKNPTRNSDQDYAFLRAEGLKYIESLASALWTDYNAHDPGITILETLCYAITELGYRNAFDIKDLLADETGNLTKDQAFFTAREILTMKPLTVLDYRKLLSDLEGVANAWMIYDHGENEVPVYANCKADELTLSPTKHPVELNGLYKVLVDLQNSDEYGDLNSSSFKYRVREGDLSGTDLIINGPAWNIFTPAQLAALSVNTITTTDEKNPREVTIAIKTTINAGEANEITFYVTLGKLSEFTARQAAITALLNTKKELEKILGQFKGKILLIQKAMDTVCTCLNANRNLCEDFLSIETVSLQQIAVCADIEAANDADLEKLQAEIYFCIETYFNPTVKFYSLKELTDEKIPVVDIFDGPALQHGFIKSDELEETNLIEEIYTSDLISLIMDIEGVIGVKNVLLTRYNNLGEAETPSQKWCMHIDAFHKPVLNTDKSKFLFFKGKLPLKADAAEVEDTLKLLRGADEKNKLTGTSLDLDTPYGKYRNLADYDTTQYELPVTYGISAAGLPPTATAQRRAQANQLRAYFMFFDQLLAGFFSQIKNAKNLYALNENKQTYYSQYLSEIRDIETIYANPSQLKDVLADASVFSTEELTTDTAAQRLYKKQIAAYRAQLFENNDTYYDRKNRFLDHLLARFSESFNNYVLALYNIEGDPTDTDKLIADKLRFLKNYPTISSERATAFNYQLPAWGTSNVSGLEKRAAGLAGISDITRRNLFCMHSISYSNTGTADAPQYKFVVTDESGHDALQSAETFTRKTDVVNAANEVYYTITSQSNYTIENPAPDKYVVKLRNSFGGPLALGVHAFKTEENAKAFIKQLILWYTPTCNSEGLYLVEHILLRPRTEAGVNLFPEVCLEPECLFEGEEDPYSFRATLVLPYWPNLFNNMDYRDFFEQTLHAEAPAHIALKICWISYTQMDQFQTAYKHWLEALAIWKSSCFSKDLAALKKFQVANNNLIALMKTLHSEYPVAHLHNCDTGTTNPVMLGRTALGSF